MNDLISAAILGFVQGVTEFLPVSSSGHIEIAEALLGVSQENSIWMTVVLHFATALSTVVVYRKDITEIILGLFKLEWNAKIEFVMKIILSMIPAGLAGFLLGDWLESLFDGQILLVGCMLITTALLLYLADRAKNTNKKVGFIHAFYIGVAQAIAILPGLSRSGSTISTSVILGIDRSESARFSFLMVIPVIFGVILKKVLGDEVGFANANLDYTALLVGFIFAFVTGILACQWMISLVKKAQLKYFSLYCIIVGLLAIVWSSL